MTVSDGEAWFDDHAGRLVRPYTVSGGRTRPTNRLDLMTLVRATGHLTSAQFDPEHAEALDLCGSVASVAEIAARMRLPVMVTKVLLSDLVDCGAVVAQDPSGMADPTDRFILEALLDGLQRRL